MNRRRALRALGSAAAVGLAGCLGGGGSTGPKVVRMVGLEYKPRRASIDVGRTIEWINDGDINHTVTAYEDRLPEGAAFFATGGFDTEAAARKHLEEGLIGEGETYRHTFDTAGEHPYFCVPHEGSGMTGVIAVR